MATNSMAADAMEEDEEDVEDLLQQLRMEKHEREQCQRLMQFLCLHHRHGVGTMRKVVRTLLEECEEDTGSCFVDVCLKMMPLIAHVDEESLEMAMDTYGKLLHERPELTKRALEGLSRMDLPSHGRQRMVRLASEAMETLTSDQLPDVIAPFLGILNDWNFREGAACICGLAENLDDGQRFLQSFLSELEFRPEMCMRWIEYCRKLDRLGLFETSMLFRFMDWTNTYKVAHNVLLYSIQKSALDFATFRIAALEGRVCEVHSLFCFLRHSLTVGPRNLFEWWLDILPCVGGEDENLCKLLTMQLLEIVASNNLEETSKSSCLNPWYAPERDYETAVSSQLLLAVVESAPKGSFELYHTLIQHIVQVSHCGCPSLTRALCAAAGFLAKTCLERKEDLLACARKLLLTPQPQAFLGGALLVCEYLKCCPRIEASRVKLLLAWVEAAAENCAPDHMKWHYVLHFVAIVAKQSEPHVLENVLHSYVLEASRNVEFAPLSCSPISVQHEDWATFIYPAGQDSDSAWSISQHMEWLVRCSAQEHIIPSRIPTEIVQSMVQVKLGLDSDSARKELYHLIAKSRICLHRDLEHAIARDDLKTAEKMQPLLLLECDMALELTAVLINSLWECFICEGLDFDPFDLLARISQYLKLESAKHCLIHHLQSSGNGCKPLDVGSLSLFRCCIKPEAWFYAGHYLCHAESPLEMPNEEVFNGVIKHCALAVEAEMVSFSCHKDAAEKAEVLVRRPFLALESLLDSNFLSVALEWCDSALQCESSGMDPARPCRIYWVIFMALACARSKSPRALLDVLQNLHDGNSAMSTSPPAESKLASSLVGILQEQLSLVGDLHTAAVLLELISLIGRSCSPDSVVAGWYEDCLRRNLPLGSKAFKVARTIIAVDTPADMYGHFVKMVLSGNSAQSAKEKLDFVFAALWHALGKEEPYPAWLAPVTGMEKLNGLQSEGAWASVCDVLLHFQIDAVQERVSRKDADLLTARTAECSLNVYRLLQLHRRAVLQGLATPALSQELMRSLPIVLRSLGRNTKFVYAATGESSSSKECEAPAYLSEMCTMAQQLLKICIELANSIRESSIPGCESLASRIPALARELSYMSSHLRRLAGAFGITLKKLPSLSTTKMQKDRQTSDISLSVLASPHSPGFLEEGLEPSDLEDSDWENDGGSNTFFITGKVPDALFRDVG